MKKEKVQRLKLKISELPISKKLKPPLDPGVPENRTIVPTPPRYGPKMLDIAQAARPKLKADTRKRSIHILVYNETHTEFKAACVDNNMNMQDFLEECISRFIQGDSYLEKIVEQFTEMKKDKTIKRVSEIDSDAVYRAISGE